MYYLTLFLAFTALILSSFKGITSAISTNEFKERTVKKLNDRILKDIENCEMPQPIDCLLSSVMQRDSKQFNKAISNLCEDKIAHSINSDMTPCKKVIRFIHLYSRYEKFNLEDSSQLEKIITSTAALWTPLHHYSRALEFTEELMKINSIKTTEMIVEVFKRLSESNDIKGLLFIYPLSKQYQINWPLFKKEQIAKNHIADAEFLFKTGDYKQAELLVKWALTLSERDTKGLALLNRIKRAERDRN